MPAHHWNCTITQQRVFKTMNAFVFPVSSQNITLAQYPRGAPDDIICISEL